MCYKDVLVAFTAGTTINEGETGSILIGYQGTLQNNLMLTVESYQCTGTNVAIRTCICT